MKDKGKEESMVRENRRTFIKVDRYVKAPKGLLTTQCASIPGHSAVQVCQMPPVSHKEIETLKLIENKRVNDSKRGEKLVFKITKANKQEVEHCRFLRRFY